MQHNTLGVVHEFLRRSVQPGAFCIDATAGKGRDTALLCRLTGDAGRVLAFDIQEAAVAQTKALLAAEGLTAEETAERAALRQEYVAAVRANLEAQLDNTLIQEPDGTRHRLPKKP